MVFVFYGKSKRIGGVLMSDWVSLTMPVERCDRAGAESEKESKLWGAPVREVKAVLRTSPDLFENATEVPNGQDIFK